MIANKVFFYIRMIVIALVLSVLLGGCTSSIDVQNQESERITLNLPDPKPVNMRDLDWTVITSKEDYEETIRALIEENKSVALFVLTEDGYENLSLNMQELRRYIIGQKFIIGKYKEYYEPTQKTEE